MARMPRRRADLATLAEVTCLIWKAPHEAACTVAEVGMGRLRLRLRVLPGQARRARREFVTDRARQQEEVEGKLR